MSTWEGPNGKVHIRRLRFHIGTKDERTVPSDVVIMLCGRRTELKPASVGMEGVTCRTCINASNTGAHHLKGES